MAQRVIVTVQFENEARVCDLELPSDVEASRLADMMARDLQLGSAGVNQPVRYQIEAYPLGRALQPHESLEKAGVWDGSWLVLHPVGTTGTVFSQHHKMSEQLLPQHGPVVGWRSLGIELPGVSDQTSPSNGDERPSGFAWKQIDE